MSKYWTPPQQQGRTARAVTEVLSVLARIVPAVYACFVCNTFWNHFVQTGKWTSFLWMVSWGQLILLFVLRRESRRLSTSPWDWIAAFGGSYAELLIRPATGALVPEIIGVSLQITGILLSIWGKIFLGKSFGLVAADRGIVAEGPYRLVRHPVYLGYLIGSVGFLLTNMSMRNTIIYIVTYFFQVSRILSEERVLSEDAKYREYRGRVHFRLIPGIF
jgi:protein-S-isoprenylcysteine O-methyltransferase Ste14